MEDHSHAEDHATPQSQMGWIAFLFRSLGVRYSVTLPFLAVLALVLVALAIWKFKTPTLTATLLAIVPLPLLYGALSFFEGLIQAYRIIILSAATPHPAEIADATAASLVGIQVGAILTLPLYFVAVTALIVRALQHSEAFPDEKPELPVTAQFAR